MSALLISRGRRVLLPLLFAGLLVSVLGAAPAQAVDPSPIVISEFRVRGPAGGLDEFVELLNPSAGAVDVSGWSISGSNAAGYTSVRATIPASTTIGPGCHYLLTAAGSGGYSGAVPGDLTYTTGITDDGGIAVKLAGGTIVDQIGMSTGSVYKEGRPALSVTGNLDRSYRRLDGGTRDTWDNLADYALVQPSLPQNSASPCDLSPPEIVPTVTPAPNAAGWNRSDATVTWSVTDAQSGIAAKTGCDTTVVSIETAGVVLTCTAVNGADGPGGASVTVMLDRTPPELYYTNALTSYTVDQQVAIGYEAEDGLSGMATETCTELTGPAYAFKLGANRFTCGGTDRAGNSATCEVGFTVQDTFAGLCALTTRFVDSQAAGLCAMLGRAEQASTPKKRALWLDNYARELKVSRVAIGLTKEELQILRRLADALK